VIGRVYRETGQLALAEARLTAAIELAVGTHSVLSEAEASRELALLYQAMGRNQDALRLLSAAHRLFGRLDARLDLVDVSGRVQRLEDTYLAWCGTGANRLNQPTPTPSGIASGWPTTRSPSPKPWAWRRRIGPPY
jgi:tetratricopeptide (TPR) repeat protein